MNQTFSPARFARLHRWLWATKRRTYLIGAGVLLLISLLMLSSILQTKGLFSDTVQKINFIFFVFTSLIMTGAIGSDVYSALFRQESAITYLMIPASRAEKFWLGVLYCMMAVTLLSVAYFCIEAWFFSIANGQLKPGQTRYVSSLVYHSRVEQHGGLDLYRLAYTLLLAMPVAWLGSFFFRRGVFIRNIGIAMGLFIVGMFLYRHIVATQFRGMDLGTNFPFSHVAVESKLTWLTLSVPDWLTFGAYGFLLVMFWLTARIRFNEIER
jgi:hypothetical protein